MAGHAEWNETPTRASTTPYDLSMYVQNPDVEPECAQSYRAQQQMSSNLDIGAASGSSWVMTSDLYISPEPPASGVDWSVESVPFVVRPGLDRVLLCAYQRFVLDDAAGYQLPVAVEQPRCRPTRRTVRRGARLALRCNVTGTISVQFHGRRRSRDATGRIDGESGTAAVSTRGLRRGRYRVRVYSGALQLGSTFRIRVR